ncbi:MAG: hypothetical protein PXY39_12490 [archaeon]|nr:hypothetical protein [archaeon]
MAPSVTRGELRKVKSIVSLIGEENLGALPNSTYQHARGLHVYVTKTEEHELSLSIWDQPKEEQTSHCLFADRISMSAFMAAVDYWKPRYPRTESY